MIRRQFLAGAALATLLGPAAGRAAPRTPPGSWTAPQVAVIGGRVIDGYGQAPIENGVVLIEGDRIVAVGERGQVKIPPNAKVIDARGRTVLPGLIETHAHLITVGHGDYPRWFKWLEQHKDAYPLERVMAISAHQLLVSGITTAVDLGAPLKESLSVRDRVARGELAGPRLHVSGPWVVPQTFLFPPPASLPVGDSAEAAAKATQANLDAGVDVIKCQGRLTGEQYKAVTDVAHKRGVKVHAHINDEPAIWDALKAKIDVLQHVGSGSYPPYSDALVRAVVDSQTAIVPTAAKSGMLPATNAFPERLEDPLLKAITPPDLWAELQSSFQDYRRLGYFRDMERADRFREESLKQWLNSGARWGVGTDNGVPLSFHTDALWRLCKLYTDLGVAPLRVISALTRVNAGILGRSADIGTLEPGKLADLVIVRGDPLADISALGSVETVIKGGAVFKGALTLSFEQSEDKSV